MNDDGADKQQESEAAVMRTLLIQDSLSMQAAVKVMLQALGNFQVVQTWRRESSAALWLAENGTAWDLAIVDLLLEDGSGFSAIRRLKAAHPAGRVLVFSEHVSEVIAEKCRRLGAEGAYSRLQLEDFVRHLERASSQP